MNEIGALKSIIDRLVAGLAKLLNTFNDVYVLLRFALIVAVTFLTGRVISARRVPAAPKEVVRDPIEEVLLKVAGSETAPDVVNLVMISTAFDIIDNLVRLIEGTELIDKEKYFPQTAMERLKAFIADVHIKINKIKDRLNIDEEYRKGIQEIVNSSIFEYCTRTYSVEPIVTEGVRPKREESVRDRTQMEFEQMFETRGEKEKKKPEKEGAIEEFLSEIADIVESYGL